jgi:DNA-binding phage protein
MPTKSYLDDHLERLLDPEYASLYLAASFSEALEDGYVDGFLLALKNVVKAASDRQEEPSETDILRQRLYQSLSKSENLTTDAITAALKAIGLTCELQPVPAPVANLSATTDLTPLSPQPVGRGG